MDWPASLARVSLEFIAIWRERDREKKKRYHHSNDSFEIFCYVLERRIGKIENIE